MRKKLITADLKGKRVILEDLNRSGSMRSTLYQPEIYLGQE